MKEIEHILDRRSIRRFSDQKIDDESIKTLLTASMYAPSAVNLQPWHFVVVSDPRLKRAIRKGAEVEEREFYSRRATVEWLEALAPLGTDENKPFLETAPYLIAIFAQKYGIDAGGNKIKHYYVKESLGIATGLLITALHHAGLVSLTYTPSPMDFLNRLLHRPSNEKPFMILVAGYPNADVTVPVISKKSLEEIATFI